MNQEAQGHLAMLLFSALVAGSFALGARVANDIAPTALNALRFGLAALLMAGVAAATTGIPRSAFQGAWRYLALGGLFASYFVLMFEGLKTAPPVSAAAVFTLTPILSGGFGWLLLRQVTTPRMALALAIGATGALWVIFRADWSAALAFQIGRGEWIYFVGCIAHAAYTPMVRLLNRGEPPIVFVLGILVAGFVCLTLYGWSDIRHTNWVGLPPLVWVALAYLSVFATCLSFLMVLLGTMRLPSAKVMAYTYLTPSWVILWEIALDEPTPTPLVMIGVGLTVVALLLLLRSDGV